MTRIGQSLGLLFWTNLASFLLWGGVFVIASAFPEARLGRYAVSLLSLGIIFPLLGLNATALLSRLARRTFDVWETFFFTTVFALFLPAFLITVLAGAGVPLTPLLPLLLTAFSFLLAAWIHPRFLESLCPKETSPRDRRLFLGAFLSYSGFIWLIVSAYPALPDLDPYYWLMRFQTELSLGQLPPIGGYRPLFASLAYLFHQAAGIDLFAYFKYVLPFLFLASLPPLMVMARRFDGLLPRLTVFTLPFATASFALYTLTPIPQSLFNLAFICFLAAISQSGRAGSHFYPIVSGTILAFSALYHEMGALPFILWIAFFALHERAFILEHVRRHAFSTILLVLLMIDLGYPLIVHLSGFVSAGLAQVISHLVLLSPNFAFPATYVNIDGNAVGWSDWRGIMKYYAYYAGPAALWAIATLSVFGKNTLAILHHYRPSANRLLFSIFGFFFLLAEILPRFFDIAFLPERAWGYASASLLAFAVFSLAALPRTLRQWLALGILCGACISAGGALYINSLKQYLLTPAHFMSAEWIKGGLPDDRVIFSYRYRNLLRVHGQSETADAPSPDFFSDIRVFDEMLHRYRTNQHSPWKAADRYLDDFSAYGAELVQGRQRQDAEAFSLALRRVETDTRALRTRMGQAGLDAGKNRPPIYVYYAKPSQRNPYAERPYMEKARMTEPEHFCFDRYPERFQRVYTLPDDEVVIWKLIE
jgi:hypothetical protein